jgi:hypothetical protein
MCEPLVPIDELRNLKWSIASLAELDNTPGSFALENKRNAARGIETRIDWIIRTLEAAGEGQKNCGA